MDPTNPAAPSTRHSTMLIMVSIGMGLLAALITTLYINHRISGDREQTFVMPVLKNSVKAGDKINKDHVQNVVFPARYRDDAQSTFHFMLPDEVQLKVLNNAVFTSDAPKGAPITLALFGENKDTSDTNDLNTGEELTAIPVKPGNQPGGLRWGDEVRISGDFNDNGQRQNKTVIARAKVYYIGNQRAPAPGAKAEVSSNYSTITIKINKDQDPKLKNLTHLLIDGYFEVTRRKPDTSDSEGLTPDALDFLTRNGVPVKKGP